MLIINCIVQATAIINILPATAFCVPIDPSGVLPCITCVPGVTGCTVGSADGWIYNTQTTRYIPQLTL